MTTSNTETGFDQFAGEYEACCARGLALAGETKEYFARERLSWLAKYLATRRIKPPDRVIDFGCGVGDVTGLLAAQFPSAEVVGLDVSRNCIERACREHSDAGISFALVDDYSPPDEERAELLHCNGVLHHVPSAERPTVVAKMVSLVRPGGQVCLFENNPRNPGTHWVMRRIPFDRDAKMISAAGTRKLLRQSGAKVHETAFLFFFPRALRILRILEPALSHMPLGAQYGVMGEVQST